MSSSSSSSSALQPWVGIGLLSGKHRNIILSDNTQHSSLRQFCMVASSAAITAFLLDWIWGSHLSELILGLLPTIFKLSAGNIFLQLPDLHHI